MKKTPLEYYNLNEIARQWKYPTNDLLYLGETEKLQLCVVLEDTLVEKRKSRPVDKKDSLFKIIQGNSTKPVYLMESTETRNIAGIYPVCGENILRIRKGRPIDGVGDFEDDSIFYVFGLIDNDLKFRPTEKRFEIADLVIPHEERVRFEKEYVSIQMEMGNRERENFLRLIGAFIERYYSKKTYRKSDNSPNADAISKEFHGWLLDNNFSDKGISEEKIRKMIPLAYNSIMENKKTKVKLKKILPS